MTGRTKRSAAIGPTAIPRCTHLIGHRHGNALARGEKGASEHHRETTNRSSGQTATAEGSNVRSIGGQRRRAVLWVWIGETLLIIQSERWKTFNV
jgi:hypothetical protein